MKEMSKKALRRRILEIRDHIPVEERIQKSGKILNRLLAAEAFQRAETIFTFVSWKSEVDTYGIIKYAWEMGKRTAVPKVEGKEIQFYEMTELSQLKPGAWNIPEPDVTKCRPAVPGGSDFMVLPGAVFDEKCGRIGYGGGFYDRYQETYPGVPNAAVAFEEQIVPVVPSEVHDIRPEMVITDRRIIWGKVQHSE